MTCVSPRSNRAVTSRHTSSTSKGSSGTRVTWAPAARPACSAIQPACRPMTSTSSTRWCDSAVVCSRSIISVAMLTAVSKPKVRSVSSMSLSIVFGMPTTGTPACDSRWAAVSVPSPPIGIRTSIPWVVEHPLHLRQPVVEPLRRDAGRPERRPAAGQQAVDGGDVQRRRPVLEQTAPAVAEADRPRCRSGWRHVRTTDRMTALRPGQSPPPVRTPMRTGSSLDRSERPTIRHDVLMFRVAGVSIRCRRPAPM